MKLFLTMLLLIVLQLSSLTVCSQRTSTDSICFSVTQAKTIMKDLKRLDYCDSITFNQQTQIMNFKDIIDLDNRIITEDRKMQLELTKTINKANIKIKVLKRISIYGIPIGFGAGIITAILLTK